MSPDTTNKRLIKIAGLAVLLLIGLILSYSFMQYFEHKGKINLNIVALPEDSTIKVDGATAKAGVSYLKTGTHTLSATRQNFDEYKRKIDTKDFKPGETIYLLPVANSAEAKAWLKLNPEVQKLREAAGGADSAQQQKNLSAKFPFLSKLPFENSFYRIDYSLTPTGNVVFTVNLFGSISSPSDYDRYKKQLASSKESALSYMQSLGIDVSKYKVIFVPDI
jgi:hypothetical protein